MTCRHEDKLGNNICEFLHYYSKLSIAQIHSRLKHQVSHQNTLPNKNLNLSLSMIHHRCQVKYNMETCPYHDVAQW